MAENELHKFHRRRMRKRYARYGADVFDTHQLMEMLLFNSIRRGDTNELAHRVLNAHPGGSLTRASNASLLSIEGVGEKTADLLSISSDMTVRLLLDKLSCEPLASDFSLRLYAWLCFANCGEKKVIALFLDEKKRLLELSCISKGRTVRPEAYLDAILQASSIAETDKEPVAYVVLAHNHLNGSNYPSVEDLYLTAFLSGGLAKRGMSLLASFVVTDNDCIMCDISSKDRQEI